MENLFDALKEKVQSFLATDGSGHDYRHAERVFNTALHLRSQEGGDQIVIGASALVHDICRPREKKTGKSHFGKEALEIIQGVLSQTGSLDDMQIDKVLHVVRLHDIYDRDHPIEKTIELQIVQDADNLDAIGALGIARTFAFGGSHGLQMYTPGESLVYEQAFEEQVGKHTTTIGHFYEKLLKLSKYMNTETGKRMAQGRHAFMEHYLEQFFAEWQGER